MSRLLQTTRVSAIPSLILTRVRGYTSGTMKAIFDNIRAVDLLQSLTEVDGNRIGVIGHSLGVTTRFLPPPLSHDLKVIVSNCGFCRFHKDDVPSWTSAKYMPRLATVYENDPDKIPFDFPEIIATFCSASLPGNCCPGGYRF